MIISKTLTSLTTAAALAATSLAPMATAANAEPWRGDRGAYSRHDGDWNSRRHDHRPRHFHRGNHDFHAYRRHKHNNTGKYIALGIGALMLGIMASEASRY